MSEGMPIHKFPDNKIEFGPWKINNGTPFQPGPPPSSVIMTGSFIPDIGNEITIIDEEWENPFVLLWNEPWDIGACCNYVPQGLVLCYTLDEISGTRINGAPGPSQHLWDLLSINNVGSETGKIGNAAVFNGSNFLSISGVNEPGVFQNPFSAAIWIKPQPRSTPEIIVGHGSSTTDGQYVYYIHLNSNGSLHIVLDEDVIFMTSTDHVTDNVWNFFFLWHDGNTLYFQLNNGTIQTVNAQFLIHGSQNSPFNLGAIGNYPGHDLFHGSMDSFLYWNRVLTSQERAVIWNNGNGI